MSGTAGEGRGSERRPPFALGQTTQHRVGGGWGGGEPWVQSQAGWLSGTGAEGKGWPEWPVRFSFAFKNDMGMCWAPHRGPVCCSMPSRRPLWSNPNPIPHSTDGVSSSLETTGLKLRNLRRPTQSIKVEVLEAGVKSKLPSHRPPRHCGTGPGSPRCWARSPGG